jgi:hypothetical protein
VKKKCDVRQKLIIKAHVICGEGFGRLNMEGEEILEAQKVEESWQQRGKTNK